MSAPGEREVNCIEHLKQEEKIEVLAMSNLSQEEDIKSLKAMFGDILKESENFAFSVTASEKKIEENSENIR